MAAMDKRVVSAAVPHILVLDTNIVLDLLVFDDPATVRLRQGIDSAALHWLAAGAMRQEFERVLAYPKIATWQRSRGKSRDEALGVFDRLSRPTSKAIPAPVRCSDPDDQMFIDLAVAHRACLLSKDQAVLRLRKRLAVLGAMVQNAWDFS